VRAFETAGRLPKGVLEGFFEKVAPLTLEMVHANPFRHEEFLRYWIERCGGSIAGETAEQSKARLEQSVLPLLRYRTGDSGRVERESCACGYRGFSIVGFAGRRACRFVTPDGRAVDAWRLAWVFQHHPLDGFRLTQESRERFRHDTSGDPPEGTARLLERLRATLVALGWPAPRIEHARVARETLAGAKPEPFLSIETQVQARHERSLTDPSASFFLSSSASSSSSS
jgi:hypothetical protein